MNETKVIPAQLDYLAGRDVIPLQHRGKRPLHKNWTKRPYVAAQVIARCKSEDRNIGIRLGERDLVIDVDPRNGGELGFKRLCKKFGIDPGQFPRTNTGSGGRHLFATLPPGLKVRDTLPDFPGVEFKSKGRQVVGPGSIHPETGKPYLFEEFLPPLDEAPPCPKSLLQAIQRPVIDFKATGGGQHSPEEIAAMLDKLDVTDYGKNDPWFELMCAVHHASGGDASEEWIDWSTSDPAFANQADVIGQRWDSLHTDKPGPITVATLYKALADAGHADMIPKPSAEDEFDIAELGEDEAKKRNKFAAQRVSALLALPSPKWIVKTLLIEGGLFEIYGRFKTGKTFWAVEMACCIATGHDFFDQPVKQGRVLYVIAEGSRKLFAYRMQAWARERSNGDEAEFDRLMSLVESNIEVVPVAVKIDVPEQVKAFIAANPGDRLLVVIDTLFRTMSGDVMNPKDFTRYVAGCDLVRRTMKTAVLFLHHQKRNEAKGGFGSVVGEASVDAALKVTAPRKGESALKLDIMRDGDAGIKPWSARIKVCKIDDPTLTGDDVDTVGVLEFSERGISRAEELLQVIRDNSPDTVAALATMADKSKATVERYLTKLRAKGLIAPKSLKLTAQGREYVTDYDADSEFDDAEEADSDDLE